MGLNTYVYGYRLKFTSKGLWHEVGKERRTGY